jgi:hypothetical protein
MTEQPPSTIGTVAQEAARLIEDMATLARSSSRTPEPSPYAGAPVQDPLSPDAPNDASHAAPSATAPGAADEPSEGVCSVCGNAGDDTAPTPTTCKLCPLCQGIALLRSVRPETVDLLADLALAMAASLRDAATRSRASAPASSATSASGGPTEGDRATVQDIHVDDESEG